MEIRLCSVLLGIFFLITPIKWINSVQQNGRNGAQTNALIPTQASPLQNAPVGGYIICYAPL